MFAMACGSCVPTRVASVSADVDGARFLPDNVVISKVTVKLLTKGLKKMGNTSEQIVELDSSKCSPVYNLQCEYRFDTYSTR